MSLWSVLVPVVAAAAGLLFATSGAIAQGGSLRTDAAALPDVIRARTHSNAELARELERLSRDVEDGTDRMAPDNTALTGLGKAANALAVPAGRTAVAGPSIEVVLNDSARTLDSLPQGFTVDDIVVHQQDVQAVVNALWAGGAEAMMIQDQRVISTSAVRCVGNTLILQGRVYSPPYRIRAIGNVTALNKALAQSKEVGIYREVASLIGLGYDVSTQAGATFPAYTGSIAPEYAASEPDAERSPTSAPTSDRRDGESSEPSSEGSKSEGSESERAERESTDREGDSR